MKSECQFTLIFIRKVRRIARDTRGQVLAMVAIALPVLFGMGALSVDLGHAFLTRNILQNASDAGARAGAAVLGAGGTQAAAQAAAVNFANQNVAPNAFLAGAVPVVNFPTATSIQVSFNFNVALFFAPVIGINTAPVAANAAAAIAAVNNVPPNSVVPLAIACNNPAGCVGVLQVGDTMTLRRYCGNFFSNSGGTCGNPDITPSQNFLVGVTFDGQNGNGNFKDTTYNGYGNEISLGDVAEPLSGNKNGWESSMEDRLAEGRNEMTLSVVRDMGNGNVEVVDFVQVRVSTMVNGGNTQDITFEIIRTAVSSTNFSNQNQGLGINSVVGVRLTQ